LNCLDFGVGYRDFEFKIFRIGFCLGFRFGFEWAFSIFFLLSAGAGVHSQAPPGMSFAQGGGVVKFSGRDLNVQYRTFNAPYGIF
jgi:hypothetical protein